MTGDTGQLDNSVEVITPENIAFRYRVAGPFRRLPAFLLDLLFQVAFVVAVAVAALLLFSTLSLPDLAGGTILVVWFAMEWFYKATFETYWNGQTPGKRLLGLRVLSVDGQPINGAQAVLRNLVRAVDVLPLMFNFIGLHQVGLVATASNRRYQRLGDVVAGTMVVIEDRDPLRDLVRIAEPQALRLAAELPASFGVPRSLARALAAYAQRRNSFVPARRAEIARLLAEPLCPLLGLPPETDADRLLCALYHRTFIAEGESCRVEASEDEALVDKIGQG